VAVLSILERRYRRATVPTGSGVLSGLFMLFMASRMKGVVGFPPTSAVSTRVRVTTAARFASKVARSISNVRCPRFFFAGSAS